MIETYISFGVIMLVIVICIFQVSKIVQCYCEKRDDDNEPPLGT